MASFSAELRVAGHVFPLRHCAYQTTQATDARGRVAAKVRYESPRLTLDVPDSDFLLAWAADPHRRHAADIVFRDAAGGSALETLRLKGAYCVSYFEEFVHGDATAGAYVAHLTLSDPDGFTTLPGGPSAGFTAPDAREYSRLVNVDAVAEQTGEQATATGASAVSDWMKAPSNPWQGKKQSGKAYLGSPPLSRSQLHNLRQAAREQYGVEMKTLKKGDEMLDMMRTLQTRAAFQASTKTVFLQPQATYYEAVHELKHAEQCTQLGVEAYSKQTRLEKETYVYEQLLKERPKLAALEVKDATRYINDLRSEAGLPLLNLY